MRSAFMLFLILFCLTTLGVAQEENREDGNAFMKRCLSAERLLDGNHDVNIDERQFLRRLSVGDARRSLFLESIRPELATSDCLHSKGRSESATRQGHDEMVPREP